MTLVDRPELLVAGYAVRTDNAAEADPARGQLPGLWQRATAPDAFAGVPGRADDRMYAVLTDYESDHHGAYTQIVGVAVTDSTAVPDAMTTVRVPAARCLLVPARGPMPQALIEAWRGVWRHTDAGVTPARTFTTDLEIHHADGADIYLAVS
ncbi:effector binding domain-containing protein [Actinoplanes sp. NPDC051346]|uniref:GyrI-like domain-containing protein n=1 Tax=Actinoplanes sp. NPDC051346 TaxID=3155048 RepID=UPI00342908F4